MAQPIPMTEGQVTPPAPKARRAVRIHLLGGMVLEGNLVVPQTRGIHELLNAPQPFVNFEASNGNKLHIAKASIQTLQMLDYPRPAGAAN